MRSYMLLFCFVLGNFLVRGGVSVLTSAERNLLLDLHNQYRRQVAAGHLADQPLSGKLRSLRWNRELERSAQAQADRCVFRHNSAAERRTSKWWWVGQNIAYSNSLARSVSMWFSEHEDYDYVSNYCYRICGHYTQLVWANTTDIGCGVRLCRNLGWDATYLVCNYGPGMLVFERTSF